MSKFPFSIPAGLVSDDTSMAASGRWADGSNIRFWNGLPQAVGGWESITSEPLRGVCRTVLLWTDRAGQLNIGFGAHSALQVWRGGSLFDITPLHALPGRTLATNPFAVTLGSSIVEVYAPSHGLMVGEAVTISGATTVGGLTCNGGLQVSNVISPDRFAFATTGAASATAVGGGEAVAIFPQRAFLPGQIDGAGGAGYGAGAYSTASYSVPSTAEYFPRTWSLGAWGENLLASPRGGAIYAWTNAPEARSEPLLNAPARSTAMLVAPQDQIFALGCDEETTGVFNPLCIRHSGVRADTEWTTGPDTTAREYVLPGGGRIVGGRVLGSSLLIWTTHALFLGTFVGALDQPWRFDRVGENCGLIGPNAAVVAGRQAFWLGPDFQFYRYDLAGAPELVVCPIRSEMVGNFAQGQGDKVIASSNSAFAEVRFDYPDARHGLENSRYLCLSLIDGTWCRGVMARTAMADAGPSPSPVGVHPDGSFYWHERGESADGMPLAWFVETADRYLSEDSTLLVRGVWPDFDEQRGPVSITLKARNTPQGEMTSEQVVSLAPGQSKADLRLSGRLFSVRFSGNSSPTRWRLGRPVFDVAPAGGR